MVDTDTSLKSFYKERTITGKLVFERFDGFLDFLLAESIFRINKAEF